LINLDKNGEEKTKYVDVKGSKLLKISEPKLLIT